MINYSINDKTKINNKAIINKLPPATITIFLGVLRLLDNCDGNSNGQVVPLAFIPLWFGGEKPLDDILKELQLYTAFIVNDFPGINDLSDALTLIGGDIVYGVITTVLFD